MSLVRMCLEHPWHLKPEHRELLKEIWPVLGTEEKYPMCEEKVIDIDEIPYWVAESDCVRVKPLKRVQFTRPNAPSLANFNAAEVKEFVKTVNQIVMPGFELLRYAHIQVQENACTNAIQLELNEGWRIIAVLPQPGQRRPDYVLVKEEK